jgi:hypothetical protein
VRVCILWACIWGGVALRQSRQALELEKLGELYYNNSAHYLADGSNLCYDVPQADVLVDGMVVFTNRLLGITPVCKFDKTRPSEAAINALNSFRFPETFSGNGMGQFLTVFYLLACVVFSFTLHYNVRLGVFHGGQVGLHRFAWDFVLDTVATTF